MSATSLPRLNLSRSRRQVLVVVQYTLQAVVLITSLRYGLDFLPAALAFVLAALASMVTHTTLALSIQNIAQARPTTLDERQRTARDQAFATTLRILTATLTGAWLYALLAAQLSLWLPPAELLWFPLWSLAMLAYTLPTAVAAWNQPDLNLP